MLLNGCIEHVLILLWFTTIAHCLRHHLFEDLVNWAFRLRIVKVKFIEQLHDLLKKPL
jgi:hypothetical protein